MQKKLRLLLAGFPLWRPGFVLFYYLFYPSPFFLFLILLISWFFFSFSIYFFHLLLFIFHLFFLLFPILYLSSAFLVFLLHYFLLSFIYHPFFFSFYFSASFFHSFLSTLYTPSPLPPLSPPSLIHHSYDRTLKGSRVTFVTHSERMSQNMLPSSANVLHDPSKEVTVPRLHHYSMNGSHEIISLSVFAP
jgi:hypothetical protein